MFLESPKIDKRSFEDLVAGMKSKYLDVVPGWKSGQGDPGLALIKIFAHMAEEVIDRLNQVPQKHFAAFLSMLGISKLPAGAALVPVTFYLSAGADLHVLIPRGSAVAAGEKDVVFETRSSFLATPAKLIKVTTAVDENENNREGLALYLGFDKKIQKGPVSMYFSLEPGENPEKSAAKVEWYYSGEEGWQVLQAVDFTRNLTESGTVEFFFAADFAMTTRFGEELFWIKAVGIAREIEQSIKKARIYPNTCMAAQVEKVGEEILGSSGGEANQAFRIRRFPVISEEIWVDESRTITAEGKRAILTGLGEGFLREIQDEAGETTAVLVRWLAAADFFASSSQDRHYVIDRAGGNVYFGDGIQGKIPPIGTDNIRVSYYLGGGTRGNVAAGEIAELRSAIPYVDSVVNPEPAQGGADTEQMAAVFKRGPYEIKHRGRAVTGEDFERLASEVSAYITRCRCIIKGNRLVMIVLPGEKTGKPKPTAALKRKVRDYLLERCPGTLGAGNILVRDPQYAAVAVRADILAGSAAAAAALEAKILEELCSFLHPLTGGPEARGWEFGRSLYISDVYALLEGIEGVDHVENLELNGQKQDVVLEKEDQILCSGKHKIEISCASLRS